MSRRSVLLFASYAELLGAERVELDLPDGATVADLVTALRTLPGGVALPIHPFVAVAHRQAAPEMVLPPGAELALLPPLAGG